MAIRRSVRQFGHTLYCHRKVAHSQVTGTATMPQAVQALKPDERRAFLQWLTQHGPYWEDMRNHGPDDWLECRGDIVTDTAVGEAGWCSLHGIARGLVSITPSAWQFSPVRVDHVSAIDGTKSVDVANHWELAVVEEVLKELPAPLATWGQLEAVARARFSQITFAIDTFLPLNGHPFVPGAAQRLLAILNTLNRFKSCSDQNGQRTPEGHEIYRNFFTGKAGDGGRGPIFSDSSETEIKEFEKELTFNHPAVPGRTLFCPWHGKVQTPQLRVHFSMPIRADEPLFVVYVGPKRTKR